MEPFGVSTDGNVPIVRVQNDFRRGILYSVPKLQLPKI